MTRRLALPICLLAALLAPSGAGAGVGALKNSSVKLAECDEAAHSATFEGGMRAFGKAVGLQMRFTLQTKPLGGEWERVEAPGFDEWLSAEAGKKAYVYDKQVKNLAIGAAYRTVIRFRFRTAAGAVLAKAVKRTPACRQPDDRPNLLVDKISLRPAATAENRIYAVRVINDGDSPVSGFSAELQVNGAKLGRTVTDPLQDGDETTIEFEAPRCGPGTAVIAGVDGAALIDESDETDNSLTLSCPESGVTFRPSRRLNGK